MLSSVDFLFLDEMMDKAFLAYTSGTHEIMFLNTTSGMELMEHTHVSGV